MCPDFRVDASCCLGLCKLYVHRTLSLHADPHELVNYKKSLFDVDMTGKNILCISTLEHVGKAEYGLKAEDNLAVSALEKITSQANKFFITIPVGWNEELDNYLVNGENDYNYRVLFLSRKSGRKANKWKEYKKLRGKQLLYRDYANSVIFIIN